MEDLTTREAVDALFQQDTAVLFKHNPTCPISAAAHGEMERFGETGAAPVHRVDIMGHRELSDYIGERTGIQHESPQVILLRAGRPAWHASKWEINAAGLTEQLGGGGA